MIRELIEKDMAEIEVVLKAVKLKEDVSISRAWTRIQMRLYRYNSLLNDISDRANDRIITNYVALEQSEINRKGKT